MIDDRMIAIDLLSLFFIDTPRHDRLSPIAAFFSLCHAATFIDRNEE